MDSDQSPQTHQCQQMDLPRGNNTGIANHNHLIILIMGFPSTGLNDIVGGDTGEYQPLSTMTKQHRLKVYDIKCADAIFHNMNIIITSIQIPMVLCSQNLWLKTSMETSLRKNRPLLERTLAIVSGKTKLDEVISAL